MGGPSYDRDVNISNSSSNFGASNDSISKLSSRTLDSTMNPRGKKIISRSKRPIVIMLDVTGSNINFARVVYDKMPMFYGQIEEKGYLKDFEISVCAVGDEKYDYYPLQIADFSKGKEIDTWMEKLVLSGGGGANEHESYELAAYYLAKNFEFDKNAKPIVFFVGDEIPYSSVSRSEAIKYGLEYGEETNGFDLLRKKVNDNVFVFLNKYFGETYRSDFADEWKRLLKKEHVIDIPEEKAIVDLMLGVLSTLNKNSLDTYKADMLGRGQSLNRIANVTAALKEFSSALVPMEIIDSNLPKEKGLSKILTRGNRIS